MAIVAVSAPQPPRVGCDGELVACLPAALVVTGLALVVVTIRRTLKEP